MPIPLRQTIRVGAYVVAQHLKGVRRYPLVLMLEPLFLDFLEGKTDFGCTAWGIPSYSLFGWQRPCYLLGEGYAGTFKELMEETDWDAYGTGNYEKCADCMVHSGYEATAVMDSVKHPMKAAAVALRGFRTEGEMAPEIPLDRQRPAEYVFSRHVEEAIAGLESRGQPAESVRGSG